MLDIKFIRENPEAVKENIRKKFKDAKLPLVDEAIALYEEKAGYQTYKITRDGSMTVEIKV